MVESTVHPSGTVQKDSAQSTTAKEHAVLEGDKPFSGMMVIIMIPVFLLVMQALLLLQ